MLTVFCFSLPAGASVINTYNDLLSWQAATDPNGRVDMAFNSNPAWTTGGLLDPYYQSSTSSPAYSAGGVDVTGFWTTSGSALQNLTQWVLFDATNAPQFAPYHFGPNAVIVGGAPGVSAGGNANAAAGLALGLGSQTGITSLAFSYSRLDFDGSGFTGYGSTAVLEVYEGGNLTGTINLSVPTGQNPNQLGFVGFRTSGDISGIRLLVPNATDTAFSVAAVYDLSFGATSPTADLPEPSNGLVALSAVVGLYLLRRRSGPAGI